MFVIARVSLLATFLASAEGILFGNKQEPAGCANIECAALSCPADFDEVKKPGACCPVCFNPDIAPKSVVTGATGESGGEASTFCENVWCFPNMCEKTPQPPTTDNGQCCPVCV